MNRKYIGFFSENELTMADNGSIKDFLVDNINYSKEKVLKYLKSGKKEASCSKQVFDVVTQKQIASCFFVYTDGEYVWKSDLEYYVKNYNLKLPEEFIAKAGAR